MAMNKEKWKKRGEFVQVWVIPIAVALAWPYILGILAGLFAALVVVGMAVRGFR